MGDMGRSHAKRVERGIAWPPEVVQQTMLGLMRDESSNYLPRDIGRSSVLSNGTILLQFGDTFVHDVDGNFSSVLENTCACIPDLRNPTLSTYRSQTSCEIETLIKRPDDELAEKYWSFSGIVEMGCDYEGKIRGLTWYKRTTLKGDLQEDYLGMGGCEVIYDVETQEVTVGAQMNVEDAIERSDVRLPSFGYVSALKTTTHIYLYGQTIDPSKSLVLARTPLPLSTDSLLPFCETYEYYCGSALGWTQDPLLVSPISDITIEHGSFFPVHPSTFSSSNGDQRYGYVFIGNTSYGDSDVIVGRAEEAEGPWDMRALEGARPHNSKGGEEPLGVGFYYCVYAHPWATGFGMCEQRDGDRKGGDGDGERNEEEARKGDLMISWSEGGMGGGVLGAILRLKMVESGG